MCPCCVFQCFSLFSVCFCTLLFIPQIECMCGVKYPNVLQNKIFAFISNVFFRSQICWRIKTFDKTFCVKVFTFLYRSFEKKIVFRKKEQFHARRSLDVLCFEPAYVFFVAYMKITVDVFVQASIRFTWKLRKSQLQRETTIISSMCKSIGNFSSTHGCVQSILIWRSEHSLFICSCEEKKPNYEFRRNTSKMNRRERNTQ